MQPREHKVKYGGNVHGRYLRGVGEFVRSGAHFMASAGSVVFRFDTRAGTGRENESAERRTLRNRTLYSFEGENT